MGLYCKRYQIGRFFFAFFLAFFAYFAVKKINRKVRKGRKVQFHAVPSILKN